MMRRSRRIRLGRSRIGVGLIVVDEVDREGGGEAVVVVGSEEEAVEAVDGVVEEASESSEWGRLETLLRGDRPTQ